MAYVFVPMTKVATLRAPSSTSKPFTPSVALPIATGLLGSVTSISCTPSSFQLATMAYVLVPMTKVATPCAPSSSVKPFTPSKGPPQLIFQRALPNLSFPFLLFKKFRQCMQRLFASGEFVRLLSGCAALTRRY